MEEDPSIVGPKNKGNLRWYLHWTFKVEKLLITLFLFLPGNGNGKGKTWSAA